MTTKEHIGNYTHQAILNIPQPTLWNPEKPYLYTMLVECENEIITDRVGIREIKVDGMQVFLNGTPIKFRGVNRHDSDPVTGPVISVEHMKRDLRMIKEHNFNAIRTSHYPNAPMFYQLCDQYGFLVIDEADHESHGAAELYCGENDVWENHTEHWNEPFADNPKFLEATMERTQRCVQRDKNRPCVICWSMGNESAYGCCFEAALAWTKNFDPARLTHYESAQYRSRKRKYDFSNIDLYSNMYPALETLQEYVDDPESDKPYLMCEYSHAMGNGPGDLEDYWQFIQANECMCGAFIWEWCDHAIYKGKAPNGKDMYWYGGDHGEYPHDGNFCMDGLVYLWDEKRENWIVDEEAAAIVRRIFAMTLEGYGPYQISSRLSQEKIEIPSVHLARYGEGVNQNRAIKDIYGWGSSTIVNILKKREYLGHTVNFKTQKHFKDKKSHYVDESEWTIFENTHEPIITQEMYDNVQRIRSNVRRYPDGWGEAAPLTGLLYCADCGAKLYNHRSRGTATKPYSSDWFDCSTYTLARQYHDSACSNHHISTKALRTLILETIRAASTYAISNEVEFIQKVRAASEVRQAQAAKDLKRKLNKDKRCCEELDTIIKKLYESYAVGRIGEERFDTLLAGYEQEQMTLRQSITEAESALDSFEQDTANVERFLALAKKYTDFSELTTPMINEFIDKIIVHAPEKIDGDRTQEVDIYLKFIGRFDLPAPELTPEEEKRQASLHRHRVKSRERYQKIKAGEHTVGQPFKLICKCCGEEFESGHSNTLFCSPRCRAKFYRQEAAESRKRECVCGNCGKAFTTTRSDVKYCCEACRRKTHSKMRYRQKWAEEQEAEIV